MLNKPHVETWHNYTFLREKKNAKKRKTAQSVAEEERAVAGFQGKNTKKKAKGKGGDWNIERFLGS